MSHQGFCLSVYMLIIMQKMEGPFPHLCSSYSNECNMMQSTEGKPAPNYIPHAPTPITSLYVLCEVGQRLGLHTNPKASVD